MNFFRSTDTTYTTIWKPSFNNLFPFLTFLVISRSANWRVNILVHHEGLKCGVKLLTRQTTHLYPYHLPRTNECVNVSHTINSIYCSAVSKVAMTISLQTKLKYRFYSSEFISFWVFLSQEFRFIVLPNTACWFSLNRTIESLLLKLFN